MKMHNPPHPGEMIREDCIKAAGLSVTAAAHSLGISRQSLSELINARNGISPEMAVRLEKVGWGVAETWLGAQLQYDLWQVKKRADSLKVRPLPAPAP